MVIHEASDRHVVYELLVELLAHQFAYPVRWIDTQDVLFSDPRVVARFIELGPASVLSTMARKTRDLKYSMRDTLLGVDRSFLASTRDQKHIHFRYDVEEDQVEPEESVVNSTQPVSIEIKPSEAVHVAPHGADVLDVDIPALERVSALIAWKLKKSPEAIKAAQSIKDISAGRSTLQNELIGDLLSEFGSTPDGAEDMSLATLAGVLETPSGKALGPELSASIFRYISSSMPGGMNTKVVRDYLAQNWGLGPMRQTSVLLYALVESNATSAKRHESATAAKVALDEAVSKYAASCGLDLRKRTDAISMGSSSGSGSIDPAVVEKVSQDQRKLASKQYAALCDYLGLNLDHETSRLATAIHLNNSHQERLDAWSSEFHPDFETGIKPRFNIKHARRFNYWWNQVRMDIMRCYHDILLGFGISTPRLQTIANRSDSKTLNMVKALSLDSISRQGCGHVNLEMERLASFIESSLSHPPVAQVSLHCMKPQTTLKENGSITYSEVPRFKSEKHDSYKTLLETGTGKTAPSCLVKCDGQWCHDEPLTLELMNGISQALGAGISFSGRTILVTGAGQESIAAELVKYLLMGGATVIVTTSREISDAQDYFRDMYSTYCARGAELRVLPFNQASVNDCKDLVNYIYEESGLGNIDALIPFAAMSERGSELDTLGFKSELAHRMMLVNVLRLLGFIVKRKRDSIITYRPTQVLLPLSPNHGIFGGDGLYGETKLGLESLLNRWHSESWKDMLTISGVIIGWTRGTGLMEANDDISEAMEENGVLTFSRQEMALNIMTLLTPTLIERCEHEPIIADFGGGLQKLTNCKAIIAEHRAKTNQRAEIRKAIYDQNARERPVDLLDAEARLSTATKSNATHLTTLKMVYPALPDYRRDIMPLSHLQGMVDLGSTVVVVGFSELGPWGTARTRWQMESQGKLTQAGYVELAWMMGLIEHSDGSSQAGYHSGWIDVKTRTNVDDSEIKTKYGSHILTHAGIRLIESDLAAENNPRNKEYLQEILLEEDLPCFDVDSTTAEAFRSRHGEHVTITPSENAEQVRIKIRAGAHIMAPKVAPFLSSLVAGLLPTGWDATKYGISEEIISQVDPVTLFTLCCVSEAFYSAGIKDPIEVFQHIHLSELGIFLGSSMGGTEKTRQMYRDVYLDKQVQSDVIQETYLNTPAAWINMLLLGGNGPIKTPVGACATGVESIDIGLESIASGKVKMCLVGGFDNFHQDESFGFSMMKATVDCEKEFASGRTPTEMSRPTAESRAGFVEAQGAGVQILCTAELALAMGLPIYGIIAGSAMAADGTGRSVPAPGQGILTFAREAAAAIHSPLLDIDYRKEQMQAEILRLLSHNGGSSPIACSAALTPETDISSPNYYQISKAPQLAIELDQPDMGFLPGMTSDALFLKIRAIKRQWGNDFRQLDRTISPMRASLAVWGLSIDDIDFAYLHGTSTKANDLNEGDVINQQMSHLRRQGPPLLAVCQKSITGHPKAPAASWMLNGCLQVLDTGLVPGNFKADNVDPALEKFNHLVYPTESIQTKSTKAFLLTSFGFGQKGGQIVGVSPRYLFGTLPMDAYEKYAAQCVARQQTTQQAYAKALLDGSLFKPQPVQQRPSGMLLDPEARNLFDTTADSTISDVHEILVHQGEEKRGIAIDSELLRDELMCLSNNGPSSSPSTPEDNERTDLLLSSTSAGAWVEQVLRERPVDVIVSVGIDTEDIEAFSSDQSATFVGRNFTAQEREHIAASPDQHTALVGRWCAKEAVFKCLRTGSKGAGAAMSQIEILSNSGAPRVVLHEDALKAAVDSNITDVLLSLTYGKHNVVAIALSVRKG